MCTEHKYCSLIFIMNQEIKVTKCSECPFLKEDYANWDFPVCFADVKNVIDIKTDANRFIHPECPLKGKSITFKIGENENTTQIYK
jgi:hypothetical protein